MLTLQKRFFFRTTWFPEKEGKLPAPWKTHGTIISSTFPNNLYFAQVAGRGIVSSKKTGFLLLDRRLKVSALAEPVFVKGKFIVSPFLSLHGGKAVLWKKEKRWKKIVLDLPADLIEQLDEIENFSASDQKELLKLGILSQLYREKVRPRISRVLSGKALDRKENLQSLLEIRKNHPDLAIIHPPVVRQIDNNHWKEIETVVNAFENIYSAAFRTGDYRQTMESFRKAFLARFGKTSVPLSEVFDPLTGISFPYLRKNAPEFVPEALKVFQSFVDRHKEEVSLSDKDLRALIRASGKLAPGERMDRGYARVSSISKDGKWQFILHQVVNGRVIRPFYPMTMLDTDLKKEFIRGLNPEDHFQVIHDLPSHLADAARGGRILPRALLIDHREFKKGDIWWRDLHCSLEGKRIVLRKSAQGPEVKIVFPAQVARELIELDVYRFLSVYSDEGAASSLAWMWPLDVTEFPRIRYGSVILSPRLWLIEADVFASEDRRLALGLPEKVFVIHASEKYLLRTGDQKSIGVLMKRIQSPDYKLTSYLRVEEAFEGATPGATTVDGSFYREEMFFPIIRGRS